MPSRQFSSILTQNQISGIDGVTRKLTSKQEAYKNARISGNGVNDSYDIAYPTHKMSRKVVSVAANKLEMDPRIAVAIQEARDNAENNAVMSREEALEKLSLSARVSITDVADFKLTEVGKDADGNAVHQTTWVIKNSEDIAPEVAACIKSITITQTGPKLELHDQNSAIKQLADMQGWNAPKKTDQTISGKLDYSDVSEQELDNKLKALLDATSSPK
jgi:phage terminase small subunit